MTSTLIELHFLPCAQYIAAILEHGGLLVERHENFVKQSYRNRCYVKTANGIIALTVPVIHNSGKTQISSLKIDYSQRWLNIHWRTLQAGYGNAPFFEFYSDDLHDILFKKPAFLYDLNLSLLTLCLSWVGYSGEITETTTYQKHVDSHIRDLRSAIHPKRSGDLKYLQSPEPYTQVFGNMFAPNLSLIDVIFCLGPGARNYVHPGKSK